MDIDGDSQMDLISGSWPGELFLFRGGAGRTFGTREKIKDKQGKVINVGGGVREQGDGSILITGDAKFESTPEGYYVDYDGKRYKNTPEKPVMLTGCASAVHAADWDGDGALDLLVGEISGYVYLVPNEGTAKSYAFGEKRALTVDGQTLRVEGDAGPFMADWDGDGDLDLIVGAGDGSVSLFRNVGSPKQPRLAKATELVGAGSIVFGPGAPKVPTRGIRSKVCVADWDGDGRLDLLVGDFASQAPDLPPPSPEQKARQDQVRDDLAKLQKRYSGLIPKIIGEGRVKDKDESEKVNKELQEISQKMQELQAKVPAEYENHGWIWLFLRKSAGGQAGLGP